MRPLKITVPADIFDDIRTGKKKDLRTKRNSRKDQYFEANTPEAANINGILYQIIRIEGTPEEWRVHLGKIL